MDFELMFCPYCGGNIDSSDESRYLCKECGKSIYTDRESLSHFIRPGELVDSFKDALAALEDDNTNKAISIADDILKASEDKDFDAYMSLLDFTPQWLSPHYSNTDADLCRKVWDKGMKIVPWTADEPEDIRRLVDLKVDAIISNYPDRVLRITRGY